MEDMPLCDNSSMLWNYHVEYLNATATGSHGIIERTKCLLPCSFMEYKVIDISQIIKSYSYHVPLKVFCLQVKGKPDLVNHHENKTRLRISFTSDRILVRKEELAFSFDSLVADCGGVLGLFLGFNFLMVWEFFINFCSFVQLAINKRQK